MSDTGTVCVSVCLPAQVIYSRSRMFSHLHTLLIALPRVAASRSFCADSDGPYVRVTTQHSADSQTVWPDEVMGPFGPQDRRFQLPGNVGFACHLEAAEADGIHRSAPDVLSEPSHTERHEFVLAQFVTHSQGNEAQTPSHNISKAELYFDNTNVECAITSCPELLKKDFESVFPEAPSSGMTVVMVTQRTSNTTILQHKESAEDMQQLLSKFVSGAKDMCMALRSAGFWADFIDPSSGLAFFGSHTQSSLLHTECRYGQRGFHIQRWGSCRVIRPGFPGTSVFVGSVFTNAPTHSSIMRKLQGHQ